MKRGNHWQSLAAVKTRCGCGQLKTRMCEVLLDCSSAQDIKDLVMGSTGYDKGSTTTVEPEPRQKDIPKAV